MTTHAFETEVTQLLHLIIHSLYSHKEIFLRELVSNASDAIDKRRHLQLTDGGDEFEARIDISFDADARTLTVSDTGIGMDEQDLIEQLGTIARSGTRSFLEQLTGDSRRDSNLIGQFGVGFYSAFMVADRIDVITRKAGCPNAFTWTSDGKGRYDIDASERDGIGTTVTVHLNDNGREYAERWRIESTVQKYSNHIAFPIYLHFSESRSEGAEQDKKTVTENKVEQINEGRAFWKRPKKDLSPDEYTEFYKTISHDYDEPLHWVHTQAEGTLEYTTLFYIPSKAPFDLYHANYRPGVKLYVKRVFITDDEKELLPTYLRFVRGIIDSEDLPLNVSREILQQNRVMEKIRSSSVKKLLDEFTTLAGDAEKYTSFYTEFGRPLKEGLYQDFPNRETLLELVRFKSTKAEGFTSLADYVGRMQPEQKSIYYITGEKEEPLRESPLLEMYAAKDIEVLLLTDDIDEIVLPAVGTYRDFEFKSINRSDAAEDLKTEADKKEEKEVEPLIARMKAVLQDEVKDVKASTRLSDSPSCVVADEKDPTVQMQGLLKSLGQSVAEFKPVLEINPNHRIVKGLQSLDDEDRFSDVCRLLLEQALLIEGVELKNPAQFVKRLNRVLGSAL